MGGTKHHQKTHITEPFFCIISSWKKGSAKSTKLNQPIIFCLNMKTTCLKIQLSQYKLFNIFKVIAFWLLYFWIFHYVYLHFFFISVNWVLKTIAVAYLFLLQVLVNQIFLFNMVKYLSVCRRWRKLGYIVSGEFLSDNDFLWYKRSL